MKVFRFPDDAIFEAWTASEERREMIRKGQALNFEVDETALEREFRRRSAEEQFPCVSGVLDTCEPRGDGVVTHRPSPAQDLRHVHGGPE